MKILSILALLLFTSSSVFAQEENAVKRLSEPIEISDAWEVYGSPMSEDVDMHPLNVIIEGAREFSGREITSHGVITEVDQELGSWIVFSEGDRNVRVTFKDKAFFVPTNCVGRHAEVRGYLQALGKATQHAASDIEGVQDDGSVAATDDDRGREYTIISTAIRIFRH